jgi:CheY-like chemotaxis protein
MWEQKKYNIVIVEDNEFYNSMLTKQLDSCATKLRKTNNYTYEIHSYTSVKDCLRNLTRDVNVAFLDYYLGDGITALDVMDAIKEKCDDCKVVVFSRTENELITKQIIANGALEFLAKDKNAFLQSGHILEDIIRGKC